MRQSLSFAAHLHGSGLNYYVESVTAGFPQTSLAEEGCLAVSACAMQPASFCPRPLNMAAFSAASCTICLQGYAPCIFAARASKALRILSRCWQFCRRQSFYILAACRITAERATVLAACRTPCEEHTWWMRTVESSGVLRVRCADAEAENASTCRACRTSHLTLSLHLP